MTWAGEEKGWILESNKPITQDQFVKIWQYTIDDQKKKISKMAYGPELKVYQTAFDHLKDMNITHSIQPQGGAN
jgi:hypothetical protein